MDREKTADRSSQDSFNATASEIEAVYPNVPKEFTLEGGSGSILYRNESPQSKLGVGVGAGVIGSREQEYFTRRVEACAVLFLQGNSHNGMFHLTPNNEEQMGYRYFKDIDPAERTKLAAKKIIDSLPQGEDFEGTLLVNQGSNDEGDYDNEKIKTDAERFAGKLQELGIRNAKVIVMPMDSTNLYYTPKRPGQIFACGKEVVLNQTGDLTETGSIKSMWLDLHSK